MGTEGDDRLLTRILGQLDAMQGTMNALAIDVATIKSGVESGDRSVEQLAENFRRSSDQTAAEMRALGVRVQALELQAATWGGAGGAAGKVGNWAASILSALLVAAIVGAIALLRK